MWPWVIAIGIVYMIGVFFVLALCSAAKRGDHHLPSAAADGEFSDVADERPLPHDGASRHDSPSPPASPTHPPTPRPDLIPEWAQKREPEHVA